MNVNDEPECDDVVYLAAADALVRAVFGMHEAGADEDDIRSALNDALGDCL